MKMTAENLLRTVAFGLALVVTGSAPAADNMKAFPPAEKGNSRLPIVVYVPEGVEVRYRVWSAGPEAKVIEEG